ncbi:THO complex subunit 1 isoform X1 [Corvus cornix cornix]|nr:THO complex subunit 1 isoform X1 [Corvus cornix cornix]XP_031979102.1 THO complex subunit 1 isoform X1 [Corvus moneduloides]XP_041886118.1 THO complex subunit 1 isoform X1 [Corvus kubaryi]XP_048145217.1 THO complex subunit 1 isoform X1 [Corvus hawaiiensis]
MSPPLFSLPEARLRFTTSTREALINKSIKPLLNAFNQVPGSENEKKCTLDQAFRVVVEEEIINKAPCENLLAIISLAINGVTEGICTASTPFVLLGDVLDCLPLDQCDKIFTFVEKNVATWKSNTFYSAGKNYLLRMCNDLLRRLSKSQNTVFCGRIQLFLARLFPLSEKSGLNLQSQFNLENVTVFNTNEHESTLGQKHTEEREEGMDVEEGEMGDDEAPTSCSIPIDYNLYRKFWSLQDYFRNPVQCYEKVSWKTFLKYSEEVLAVFKSYKLDDTQASRKKLEELKTGGEHVYFAKFLTSEKLMDLQLSDSNFRRHILLQYLILFQYLKGQVKFKSSNYVLTDEQSLWIEDTTKAVYQLLSENPPDGERFSKMVEHILNTEENWNSWKNEGCPSFVKERSHPEFQLGPPDSKPMRPVRKRPAPEDFLGKGSNKKILMGNEELTRLWNLCPDNMEACKSESREYMPTLEEFFEEAIEQADPENMVENKYKAVNNSNYGWRALRLLARRSPHFFQPTNQQFKSLPEYLENMVIKLAKELPPPSEEIKTGEDEDEEDNDALLKENNESPEVQRDKAMTGEQIESFANRLGEQWKALAPYLEMKESDIRQIELDSEDVKMRAKQLLVAWQDQEGAHATPENLITALSKAGLGDLAESLTNDTEGSS